MTFDLKVTRVCIMWHKFLLFQTLDFHCIFDTLLRLLLPLSGPFSTISIFVFQAFHWSRFLPFALFFAFYTWVLGFCYSWVGTLLVTFRLLGIPPASPASLNLGVVTAELFRSPDGPLIA